MLEDLQVLTYYWESFIPPGCSVLHKRTRSITPIVHQLCNRSLCLRHSLQPMRRHLLIRMLWHHRASSDCDKSALAGGMLGATGRTISWLYGAQVRWEFPVKFAIARLPVHPGGSSAAISEWHDTQMPALHAQVVYDYDDARGVVVFGNAFGELSLYDFSDSDPDIFGGWLASKLVVPPRADQSLASTVCITINFQPHTHILIHD